MSDKTQSMLKLGIIREGKVPPDARVPLTPAQIAQIEKDFQVDACVQPFPGRCFPDEAYQAAGVRLAEDLDDREVLLGVKEVPLDQLLPGKTYCFFSHTIKKQAYNRKLLQRILELNIRLIDYEVLTNERGQRLIAFGRFAGMVGAHNALFTYGKRLGNFALPRMLEFDEYADAQRYYAESLRLPTLKAVLTGTGRVAQGAAEVLLDMGFKQVDIPTFLHQQAEGPTFVQIDCLDYARRKDGATFSKQDFYKKPKEFESAFAPFTAVADVFINGIYWDSDAPAFFKQEDMTDPGFHIQVIADVTCDIAPLSSVPSTIRASTIAEPVFGFDPKLGVEIPAGSPEGIDIMSIDNLPSELPRDASRAFGEQFIAHILPEFFKEHSEVLERATIAADGKLTPRYAYLQGYVDELTSE